MDFFVVTVACVLFFGGLVLVIQGFVRKEPYGFGDIRPGYDWYGMRSEGFGADGIVHPPERHPVRLMLIGLPLMIVAVVILAVAM